MLPDTSDTSASRYAKEGNIEANASRAFWLELRHVMFRTKDNHQAIQCIRQQQMTPECRTRYMQRAGVEGTLSQGVQAYELRETRYFWLAKTHLQHILIAPSINIVRIVAWLSDIPRPKPRVSHFAAPAPQAPALPA